MRRRHDRLTRLARFFEARSKLARARLGALTRAEAELERRTQDIFAALDRPGPCQFLFADATARRLVSLARERSALAQDIAAEHVNLRNAELRARVAGRTIDRLKSALNDIEQRRRLEELATDLAQASASGKRSPPMF